jgi:hypothetical protein
MNERIKELAEQALKTSMVHDGMYRPEGYANGVSKDFADKFADLIVRECCAVADEAEKSDVLFLASKFIKIHFGVEE